MGLAEPNSSDNEGYDKIPFAGTRLFGGGDIDNSSVGSFRRLSEKEDDDMMMLSPPPSAQKRLPIQRLFGGGDSSCRQPLPQSPPLCTITTTNINPYTSVSTNAQLNLHQGGGSSAPLSSAASSNETDDGEDTDVMSEDETEVVLSSPLPIHTKSSAKKKKLSNDKPPLPPISPPQTIIKKSPVPLTKVSSYKVDGQTEHLNNDANYEYKQGNGPEQFYGGRNLLSSPGIILPPLSSHRRKKPSGYHPFGREDVFGELYSDDDDDDFLKSSFPSPDARSSRRRKSRGHQRSLTADSILQIFGKENVPPSPTLSAGGASRPKIESSSSFDLHDRFVRDTTRGSHSRKYFSMQRNDVNNRGLFFDEPSSPLTFSYDKGNDDNKENKNKSGGETRDYNGNNGDNIFQDKNTDAENNTQGTKSGGYAPKSGRYSFTASPIDETDEQVYNATMNDPTRGVGNGGDGGMGLKARRLNLGPEVGTLTVDCNAEYHNKSAANNPSDDISPTDVFSFPEAPAKRIFTRNSSIEGRLSTTPRSDVPPTPIVERRSNNRRRRQRHHFGSDYESDEDSCDSFGEENGIDDRCGTIRKHPRHRRQHSGDGNQRPRQRCLSESRFLSDFQIVTQIGAGSFGSVYKCLSRVDGCLYAVKVAKRKAKGMADRQRMLKEVYALAALSDQADTAAFHIVRYHQAWIEDSRLHIQTELCTSTLMEVMANGMMGEKRRYKLLREILLALELIHKSDMVHLDIKPENIFMKNDQFKLGDFGLVSKITNSDVEEGDSRYMSMELLSGDHKDLTKCDIFSLGATMYEVCLGRFLPANGQEWQDIRAGTLSPMRETPTELQKIVEDMMQPNAELRPSATTLLKKRQLLSDEQQQLLVEKNKVTEATLALAAEKERLRKLTPPRGKGKLIRANTWNGGSLGF